MQNPLLAFVKAANSANGIRNTLQLAKSEEGIAILPTELDSDPWLLNVENGTLELKTGQLRAHRRSDYITKLAPVVYDPAAKCPMWKHFLEVVMNGNEDLIQFLQRAAGYSLTGVVREHALFFLYGLGRNGKGTYLQTMLELLGGDYAMKAPPDLLIAKHNDQHPTALADLQGKRLVVSMEVEQGRRLAESQLKEMTGGDTLRARRMREDFWQFNPTHKLWLGANYKPAVQGRDDGIWRRIKLIPFAVTIPKEKEDVELPEKLRTEMPGILNWCIEGCWQWQRAGLAEPAEVRAATAEYRQSEDTIAAFVGDCCVLAGDSRCKASSLREAYEEWCKAQGDQPESGRRLGEYLASIGVTKRSSNGTWYQGIAIR